MAKDRKKAKREKKRLKSLRGMRSRRNEWKRKSNINNTGFKIIPKSKK